MDMLGTEIERYPLISARSAGANSVAFIVSTDPNYLMVTLTAHGLSSGESIPIQIQAEDGTWGDASSTDPNTLVEKPVALTYGANTITINGIGKYRVAKPITLLPTSVTLYR